MSKPSKKRPKTANRDAAGKFKPGHKGGPGRPEGSRSSATIMLEKLMSDDGENVIKAVVKAAKGGDMRAAKLVIDRLLPTPRGRRVLLDLPVIKTAEDVLKALTATVAAMGDGELAPDEAATVAGVIEVKRRAIETVELERRIAAIEEAGAEK